VTGCFIIIDNNMRWDMWYLHVLNVYVCFAGVFVGH
jgi:hypothetical protein